MSNINKEYRLEITNKIIEALKNGTAPWQRNWFGDDMPLNAITGSRYRGTNSLLLSVAGDVLDNGANPRWCTYLQAKLNGWKIKKDSSGTRIFFWKTISVKSNEVIDDYCDETSDALKTIPVMKFFTVFHASQIEGIEPYAPTKVNKVIANQIVENIIINSGADIRYKGFRAFYSPVEDYIQIPQPEYFFDTNAYYSTLLHELAYWTGHELKRNMQLNKTSPAYAQEELVAEIASMFLSYETGIPQTQEHFDNHAAYIASWISLLSSNCNILFKAASDAEKIVDLLLRFKFKNVSKS